MGSLTRLRLNGLISGAMLLATLVTAAGAAEDVPPVDEIVNRANFMSYFQGRDGRSQVEMEIKDSQDRVRRRRMTILRRDAPETDSLENNAYRGQQKYYVYFQRPADVSKMALVVWRNVAGDDDRWLYLPALDLVKRIAASDQRTSFAGSDFFYEDVSGRGVDADTHELIEVTDNYYVLRSRPKSPGTVEFAYYKSFIHKTSFLPIQIEYYDGSDNRYRVYTALKVQSIQGYQTVTQSRMENLKTGGTTTLIYSNVAYDVGLPETVFTERYLRRAPVKYLR